MSMDAEKLYALLPAVYRSRDAEQGYPLKALISIIAEQAEVLEEDLDQLYDDQFIETCAEWVVPYIGDLIGARGIYALTKSSFSQRAQVANTIAYRRRKGTVALLEQLAHDVTGWDAKVVEFFQLLATTQYMNHLRPGNLYSPDLRKWEPLERLNTAFESTDHTVDVRSISRRKGKYNIPNVGIFIWRLGSHSLTDSPAFEVGDRRYMFSPLGNDLALYNHPESEDQIEHMAEPINVPMPISRRVLDQYLEVYYGKGKSLTISVDGEEIPVEKVVACDLSDIKSDELMGPANWAHHPEDKVGIDPVLGRITFPEFLFLESLSSEPHSNPVITVSYHYGFGDNLGGGEYERADTFSKDLGIVTVPKPYSNLETALDSVKGGGVVEMEGSGRYEVPPEATLIVFADKDCRVELRAANKSRPFLKGIIEIQGEEGAEVVLNGLLMGGYELAAGNSGTLGSQQCIIRVTGNLSRLRLIHCTLVPGVSLSRNGTPQQATPSLIIEAPDTVVEIERCITGGLRAPEGARVIITNSIVDATERSDAAAYAALNDDEPAGPMHIENCTVIGKVNTLVLEYASNSIFMANVEAKRLQQGCVRFCYLPLDSHMPKRYHCQPECEEYANRVRPVFTSMHYGDPGYCQLSQRCSAKIRQGADDESEMGTFHDLYQPQRETNFRVRLDEYLRFGLEAGIFYES
jgi:hypothetical protein